MIPSFMFPLVNKDGVIGIALYCTKVLGFRIVELLVSVFQDFYCIYFFHSAIFTAFHILCKW